MGRAEAEEPACLDCHFCILPDRWPALKAIRAPIGHRQRNSAETQPKQMANSIKKRNLPALLSPAIPLRGDSAKVPEPPRYGSFGGGARTRPTRLPAGTRAESSPAVCQNGSVPDRQCESRGMFAVCSRCVRGVYAVEGSREGSKKIRRRFKSVVGLWAGASYSASPLPSGTASSRMEVRRVVWDGDEFRGNDQPCRSQLPAHAARN